MVPARVAAWLERHAGLDEYRRANRGTDPDVDDVLNALHQVALAWRGSATGTRDAQPPEPAAHSPQWLTSTQAAEILNITDRGVRKAIRTGHLKAENLGGRWRISLEDTHHYKAQQRT